MVHHTPTNKAMKESQPCKCFNRNGGNAIPKHAYPEAKGSNPTAGISLLWARNTFRGNSNYWQVSQEDAKELNISPVLNKIQD
jgi:hypothetical protein